MTEEPYAYVKRSYGVNPIIGGRVTMIESNRSGTIVRKQAYDHYVHVKFDGTSFSVPVHPLDLKYTAQATQAGPTKGR